MNSNDMKRHSYIRNAFVCFICTAVCIAMDVRNFIDAGGFYWDWNIGLSIVLYVVLIGLGIRLIRKSKQQKE